MHTQTHRLASATRTALSSITLMLLAAVPAAAATSTWVAAGGDSKFTTALNWDAVPSSNGNLVFNSGSPFAAKPSPVNDYSTVLVVNDINIYAAYNISGAGIQCNGINDNNATDSTVSMPLATQGTGVMTIIVTGAGAHLYLPGIISGAGPVTHSGPGHKVLSGANTVAGITSLSQGTLHIWGSQTSSVINVTAGVLVLANDAMVSNVTLGSTGSTLSFNETLATKNMHATCANLAIASGSRFSLITKGPTAVDYSNIHATNVDLSGATLLVDTSTYMPASGSVMTIIHTAGTLTGTFTGYPEGSIVTSMTNPATSFIITYTGGLGGKDVVLTGRPGNGAGTAGGTSTGWATTAGTSGAVASSGHKRRCGLGGGALALLLALGLFAARRKA